MNLFERAAGVVMAGFDGCSIDEARDAVAQAPFGGYILFARNVTSLERVRALTDALRARAEPPPLIAIDQEGGRVTRIRDGVTDLPPMMALGATRSEQLAVSAGEQLAFDLRRSGITIDFAPVFDLALQPGNTVIGNRAFGASPELVSQLGVAFARGMQAAGMPATAKHFPGHGATSVDSHLALPRLDDDLSTLRARDLLPFVRAASEVQAMMVAHVVVAGLDPERPASIAAPAYAMLRRDCDFRGVCFTDDMEMDAIARGIGTVEGVAAAIAAGADCAIVSHDAALARRAAEHLVACVEGGSLPLERLVEAHDRMMALRAAAASPLPLDAASPHPSIGRRIARDAVTLVRGLAEADPGACAVLSFTDGADALLREAPALVRATDRETRRRTIVLSHRAHLDDAQRRAIDAVLTERPDSIVVSTAEPYDTALFPQARHLLACYGDDRPSMAGLADVLFSSHEARGVLPVDV